MSFSEDEKRAATQATVSIVNNIGVMNNSQLQQHSPHANQTLTIGVDPSALLALAQEIRNSLDALKLDHADPAEIEAELQTLEAQAKSPKPKTSILHET